MVNFDNELNKVEYIKPMTSGEPGNRVFSIELYTSQKSYKIFVEKEQLISVSEYIIRNLYSINVSDSNGEENKHDFNYIDEEIKLILFIFFILVIFTHRKNISNLKNKIEHKIKI